MVQVVPDTTPSSPSLNAQATSSGIAFPAMWSLRNLHPASELIVEHLRAGRTLGIVGDSDADGVTSSALMTRFLEAQGGKVEVRIPSRIASTTRGVSIECVDDLAAHGCGLIILLDHGTTSHAQLEYMREKGIRSIVIDHHEVPEKEPPCDVLVNPSHSECRFTEHTPTGAGTTYIVCEGIAAALTAVGIESEVVAGSRLLGALGTVVDMGTMKDFNFALTKSGFEKSEIDALPGIKVAMKELGVRAPLSVAKMNTNIGPLVNAAGRMGDPEQAFKLLIAKSDAEAIEALRRLQELKNQQGELRQKGIEIANGIVEQSEQGNVVLIISEEIDPRIVNLVSQKMAQGLGKPAIVVAGSGPIRAGSSRSPRADVYSFLEGCRDLFIAFGGHKNAAGFTIAASNLEALQEYHRKTAIFVKDLAEKGVPPTHPATVVEMTLLDLTMEKVEALEGSGPFTDENPETLSKLCGMELISRSELKAKHTKLILSDGEQYISAYLWNQTGLEHLKVGMTLNVVARPTLDEYRGALSIILHLTEPPEVLAPATSTTPLTPQAELFTDWEAKLVQSKDDFSDICSRLSSRAVLGIDTETVFVEGVSQTLCLVLIADPENKISYLCDVMALGDDISILKSILESAEIKKIEQYSQFEDARFRHYNIKQNGVEDPRLLAKDLLPFLESYSLKSLAAFLCGIQMNKEEQKGDWSQRPFSAEQIYYGKLDPIITLKVHEALLALQARYQPEAGESLDKIMEKWSAGEAELQSAEQENERLCYLAERSVELKKAVEWALKNDRPCFEGTTGSAKLYTSSSNNIVMDRVQAKLLEWTQGRVTEEQIDDAIAKGCSVPTSGLQAKLREGMQALELPSLSRTEMSALAKKIVQEEVGIIPDKYEVKLTTAPRKRAEASEPTDELQERSIRDMMKELSHIERERFVIRTVEHPDIARMMMRNSAYRLEARQRAYKGETYEEKTIGRVGTKKELTSVSPLAIDRALTPIVPDSVKRKALIDSLKPTLNRDGFVGVLVEFGITDSDTADNHVKEVLEKQLGSLKTSVQVEWDHRSVPLVLADLLSNP